MWWLARKHSSYAMWNVQQGANSIEVLNYRLGANKHVVIVIYCHVVMKIFDHGVKITWNGQNREGAMCTRVEGVMVTCVHYHVVNGNKMRIIKFHR